MLRYTKSKVTFSEYPGKVTLTIQISGCPFRCEGCHSPELRNDIGHRLTTTALYQMIIVNNTSNQLDAVCFLGCGGKYESLDELFAITKSMNLETILYTGSDHDFMESSHMKRWIENGIIDAIKTGPYIESCGGLDNHQTNQRFIHMKFGDLTYQFQN